MTATDWPLGIADRSAPPHTRRLHALIADDHRSTSFSVWETLSAQTGVGTISTAESFDAALAMTRSELPDVCLVSAEFGAGEGLRLTYRLKRLQRARPVLVYAAPVHSRLAGAAMIADADDDIAAWLGISASSFRLRREVIVRCLDGSVRFGAAAAASS